MSATLMLRVIAVVALSVLIGCIRYPASRTDIPDERPSLAFSGAPDGSIVYVDGQAMGEATQFDGGQSVLLVEPGTHVIAVRLGDRVLLEQRVFLSGQATRTLMVR